MESYKMETCLLVAEINQHMKCQDQDNTCDAQGLVPSYKRNHGEVMEEDANHLWLIVGVIDLRERTQEVRRPWYLTLPDNLSSVQLTTHDTTFSLTHPIHIEIEMGVEWFHDGDTQCKDSYLKWCIESNIADTDIVNPTIECRNLQMHDGHNQYSKTRMWMATWIILERSYQINQHHANPTN